MEIRKNSIYIPLGCLINNLYDELKITIDYYKGGVNYFNGAYEKRGIYAYLKPIKRNGLVERTTLISGDIFETGFKVLLKECGRLNRQRNEKIFNAIANDEEFLLNIKDNYLKHDYLKVINLLQGDKIYFY